MPKAEPPAIQISVPSFGVSFLLAFAVLAAVVSVIYFRSLDAPLIYDDIITIEENRSITQLWPLWGNADHPGPLRPPLDFPTAARPLVNLSFAVNYHFGNIAPRGYRLLNLVLHLANAMLLWAIARRTLRLPYFAGRFDRTAGWLALAVALVWAVHPLLTEAVVYITQRTELMVACFYLGTIYCSLRYWTAETPGRQRGWLLLATLACLAGAASKEVIVSAPLVVLLFEWTFMSKTLREMLRRSWPLYLGLASSWLLLAGLQWNSPRSQSAGFGLGVSLVDWWSTQAGIFWMYLKLAGYPWPLLIHYEMSLATFATNWMYVAAAAALCMLILGLLWRRRAAGFLLACVVLILAPTHLVPIPTELAAERRMYLPLAALVALVAVGAFALIVAAAERSPRSQPGSSVRRGAAIAAAAATFLLALVYAFTSSQRVAVFNDPAALWQEVADLQPANYIALHGYAVELGNVGRRAEAVEYYRRALRLNPQMAEAHYGLGLTLAQLGQYDESIQHLQAVVELKPEAFRLRNNLGVVLFTAGRYPEAIVEFEKTLQIQPDFVEAQENLNRARQASVLPKEDQ